MVNHSYRIQVFRANRMYRMYLRPLAYFEHTQSKWFCMSAFLELPFLARAVRISAANSHLLLLHSAEGLVLAVKQ
jgi:hypothetical protein